MKVLIFLVLCLVLCIHKIGFCNDPKDDDLTSKVNLIEINDISFDDDYFSTSCSYFENTYVFNPDGVRIKYVIKEKRIMYVGCENKNQYNLLYIFLRDGSEIVINIDDISYSIYPIVESTSDINCPVLHLNGEECSWNKYPKRHNQ